MDEEQAVRDLEYIRSVMKEVRHRNAIDAIYYIIWGSIIPLCTATTWILVSFDAADRVGVIWLSGMALGAVTCYIAGWVRNRNTNWSPFKGEARLYYTAWIMFGITSLSVMAIGWGFGKLNLQQILFILGILLSLVYAVDASFSGLHWLYFVSAGWLAIGVLAIWLPLLGSSLVFGFATLPLQLIPGLILNRIYIRERNGSA